LFSQQLEFSTPETHRGNTALRATYVTSYPKIEVHGRVNHTVIGHLIVIGQWGYIIL